MRKPTLSPSAERLLVLAFICGSVVELLVHADTDDPVLAAVWIIAIELPLFIRRTNPVAGTIAASALLAAAPAVTGRFQPGLFLLVLPVVLAYACGAYAETGPGLAATAALTVALQVATGFADAPNLEIAITTLPVWLVGREVRRRRQLVRELAERTRELQAEEEAFVRLSVQHERARIARDLHDIVSHHVALMVIQAGAGRLAEPWDYRVAESRFATIRDAGVQALTEADRLVTVLRPDARHARLAPLLARARELGAHVVVAPQDLPLPPGLEALAHHVAREAITNAMKHAPGEKLYLELSLDNTVLTITARNNRVATASPIAATGSGLGLAGMQERVASAGGSVVTESDEDGFVLRASLPCGASHPTVAVA
jgi:signal transduction histidine kinase